LFAGAHLTRALVGTMAGELAVVIAGATLHGAVIRIVVTCLVAGVIITALDGRAADTDAGTASTVVGTQRPHRHGNSTAHRRCATDSGASSSGRGGSPTAAGAACAFRSATRYDGGTARKEKCRSERNDADARVQSNNAWKFHDC